MLEQERGATHRKIISFAVFSAMILVSIVGCATGRPRISQDLQQSFQKLVPINDMNRNLILRAVPASQQGFKNNTDIAVEMQNLSDKQIYQPLGYGIRLFVAKDDKWIEVKNGVEYIGDASILQPKGSEPEDQSSTWVRPVIGSDLQKEGEPTILRIVMLGELMSNAKPSDVPVGAYTDVFINP